MWAMRAAAERAYTGNPQSRPVYRCDKPNLMMGLPRCMTFGGPRVDAAIGRELLLAVEPMAIDAAFEAERMHREQQEDQQRIRDLEVQQNMTQAWPSVATRPAIRTIASLPHSWRRTGRLLSGGSEIWRHAGPLKSDQVSRSTRTPSPTWRTICRRPGMRPVSRRGLASSCFGR